VLQPRCDPDPNYSPVGTIIIFTVVFYSYMLAVYSGRLAKGPYQESNPASDGGFMVFLLSSVHANGGFYYYAVLVKLMIHMNSLRKNKLGYGKSKSKH